MIVFAGTRMDSPPAVHKSRLPETLPFGKPVFHDERLRVDCGRGVCGSRYPARLAPGSVIRFVAATPAEARALAVGAGNRLAALALSLGGNANTTAP